MPLITYRSALVGRCAFNLVLVGLPVNINEDNNFRAYSYLLHNKNYQLPRFQKNWGPLITHGLFMGYELPMVMDKLWITSGRFHFSLVAVKKYGLY